MSKQPPPLASFLQATIDDVEEIGAECKTHAGKAVAGLEFRHNRRLDAMHVNVTRIDGNQRRFAEQAASKQDVKTAHAAGITAQQLALRNRQGMKAVLHKVGHFLTQLDRARVAGDKLVTQQLCTAVRNELDTLRSELMAYAIDEEELKQWLGGLEGEIEMELDAIRAEQTALRQRQDAREALDEDRLRHAARADGKLIQAFTDLAAKDEVRDAALAAANQRIDVLTEEVGVLRQQQESAQFAADSRLIELEQRKSFEEAATTLVDLPVPEVPHGLVASVASILGGAFGLARTLAGAVREALVGRPRYAYGSLALALLFGGTTAAFAFVDPPKTHSDVAQPTAEPAPLRCTYYELTTRTSTSVPMIRASKGRFKDLWLAKCGDSLYFTALEELPTEVPASDLLFWKHL